MKDNSTKVFFVRHGVTAQTGKILYGQNLGIELSEEGSKQADLTGEYLSNIKIDKIFSSPLERAYQTAEKIAKYQEVEIELKPDLIDTDTGAFTNMKLSDAAKEKDWATIVSRPSQYSFVDGESFQDVFVRMNRQVDEIVENNRGKNIVISSHRDPIIMMMAHYLGIHMDGFQRIPCAPASLSIVNFYKKYVDVKGIGTVPAARIEE